MTTVTLTEQDFAKLTSEQVAEVANRLEQDDYSTPFAGLQDWHLLRAIAFHRPELIEPYVYLLDIEEHDES